jgi:hypothetical protein
MISLFTRAEAVRIAIIITSGGGAKPVRRPEIEIRNALVDYWGGKGGDCEDERLNYLGGGVRVRIREGSETRVVAEVDSWCGGHSGIAVLTRKIGPVEEGSLTDWEDGPP